jgi:hypothetical protein
VTAPDLTATQVAGLSEVCIQAVRDWANHGKLPSRLVQGRRRFPAQAAAELAHQHHIPLPDWLRAETPTPGRAR